MKTKYLIFIAILVLSLGACSYPHYLTSSQKIGEGKHGSYIAVSKLNGQTIRGELIALNIEEMVVLTQKTATCEVIPVYEISRFRVRYAIPKNYAWTIPVFSVFTFLHGWYAAATFPVNVLVTVTASLAGENSFTYNNRNMSYERLVMFARFPQGIPPNVDMAEIGW